VHLRVQLKFTSITYAVQSPPKTFVASTNVAVLIDPVTKGWKEELIKAEFSEDEAKVITGIPLSPGLPPDRMFWRGTIDGRFTVRSAYHLGKETEAMEAGQCSYVGEGVEVWKAIWALQVPSPVKLFIWRACHNILPTRVNLTQKKVLEDSSCPCCGEAVETICHTFWECPVARVVWGGNSSIFHKCQWAGNDFKLLLKYCLERVSREELDLMAVVSRRIWLRRNSLIF
jgi:hypothetical protein